MDGEALQRNGVLYGKNKKKKKKKKKKCDDYFRIFPCKRAVCTWKINE